MLLNGLTDSKGILHDNLIFIKLIILLYYQAVKSIKFQFYFI